MKLYHFISQRYALSAIKDRRLKIASINELNDPFEFLGWNLHDREVRKKHKAWKNERDKELGLLCFSAVWTHPLLWEHYADKHQGIALGFEVPDDDTYSQVHYCAERLWR
ncbi:hypothetical protein NKY66_10695 [Sinorhizobium meliloti]|uniref:hypothetical protein n=1 Tax=Rhizobium meliloti TaxID=382 RepID=UPI003D65181E